MHTQITKNAIASSEKPLGKAAIKILKKLIKLGNRKLERKMKAGKYYIGDPGYLFDDKTWEEIGVLTDYFNKSGIFNYKGFEFAGGHTAGGDGEFIDSKGYLYGVDAGCLACLPIKMMLLCDVAPPTGSFRIVKFQHEFEVLIKEGVFKFGHVRINTR